jgi:integrase
MLTQKKIDSLLREPPPKRTETPDGQISGLYFVRQPATGAASWALRYRVGGEPRKLTLGGYPAVPLAAARRRAQEALGGVAAGKDPAREKTVARAAAKAAGEAEEDRVESVVERFIERHAKPNTRDWRETERMLVNEVVARWKGRRLSQITKANVHDLLDSIVDSGRPVRANRVFAQFRKLCRWAIGRGLIEKSPCDGLAAPSPETKRERVLADAEIKLVWAAADKLGYPFGPVLKLLLLTGARRDEVAGMRWSEIDLEARIWTLPAARSKNRREHQVPLSDAAMEILKALPRHEKVDFAFSTTGKTPISGFSKTKVNIDTSIAAQMREAGGVAPMPGWTLHDIRRSVATNLQKLGVRLEVTEAVLNHVSGSRAGIVGVYQKHEWKDEKRAALDAWARRLDAIVTGAVIGNVIDLAKARG